MQMNRSTPDIEFGADLDLNSKGWKRRFMAGSDQVKEAIQLYIQLGFDVHTESVKPSELSDLCGDCRLATCRTYETLYTRKLG